MAAVPIEVIVIVGEKRGTVQLVGDPSDALTAHNVGHAVSVFILESAGA